MHRRQGARTIDRADSSILDLSEKLRFPKICERWMRMKRRLIFFFFLPPPPPNRIERTHARTPFIVCIVHEIIIQAGFDYSREKMGFFFLFFFFVKSIDIVLSFSSHGTKTKSNKFVRSCRKFPFVFSSFSGKINFREIKIGPLVYGTWCTEPS